MLAIMPLAHYLALALSFGIDTGLLPQFRTYAQTQYIVESHPCANRCCFKAQACVSPNLIGDQTREIRVFQAQFLLL